MAYLPIVWAGALLPESEPASLQSASLQLRQQAAGPPKQHKPSSVTVAQLNRWYEKGHPSNRVASAGVLVHAHDNTERMGAGNLAQPSGGQFSQFWATSLVNTQMPALYQYNCGIVLDPQYVKLLCSFYMDFTSWTEGCNRTNLAQLTPGASEDEGRKVANWARNSPYPPEMFEDMLNTSLSMQNQQTASFRYNEVLVNSTAYRESLPGSVAGVFYVHRADDPGDPECAMAAHSALVELYGLKPEDVMLLRHTPRATPAFILHSEAARKEEKEAKKAKKAEKAAAEEQEQAQGAQGEQGEAATGEIKCKVLTPGLTDEWCVAACSAAANCPKDVCECDATSREVLRQRLGQRRSQREWRDYWWSALTPGHDQARGANV